VLSKCYFDFFRHCEPPLRFSPNQEALSNHFNLLEDEHRQRCQQVWESLTLRQREILRALSAGLDRQEIADQFSISVTTYDSHRSEILKKCELVWLRNNQTFKERYWQTLFSTFLKGHGLI
jgi:DNA-binding CsgD family transcriptional regulator